MLPGRRCAAHGRDLAALGAAHPGAALVGLDADAAMLARAQERLGADGREVALVQADLGRPLGPDVLAAARAPVDAVTSVAAFHWVLDTPTLAADLAALLRTGGRLVAECGGAGQLAAVDEVLVALGARPKHDVVFRDAASWGDALAAAGFEVERVALRPDPLQLPDLDLLARYLEVVVLRLHVAALPVAERTPFARAVAERLPDRTVDYVRLEVEAVRVVVVEG